MSQAALTESTSEGAAPGTQIVPGYEVVRLMRTGNRLMTYDVYSRERHCRCVLKVIRDDRLHEERCRRALLLEGRLARDLAHPHLVRAYDVIEHPRAAVVLETLSGDTLGALIEDEPLTPSDAALLGCQLASALSYVHSHDWLHLDVKPSNVVVQAGRAVLIDFSVVSRPGEGRPHAGTDGYLSPEQARGRDLTAASDVFGLGVTLGESLTGELPYGEESRWRRGFAPRTPARAFRRGLSRVPDPMAELILAAVHPEPTRRPSMRDVRAVLGGFVTDPAAPPATGDHRSG